MQSTLHENWGRKALNLSLFLAAVVAFPIWVAGAAGPAGADIIRGTHGDDVLHGTPGDDRMRGRHGNDVLWGLRGADVLLGGGGLDILYGGHGSDTLWDGYRSGTLHGGPGADVLHGRTHTEQHGGLGEDVIHTVGGTAFAGSGADAVEAVGRGYDMHVLAGPGDDRIDVHAPYAGEAEEPDAMYVFDCGAGYDSLHWHTGVHQAPFSWAASLECERIVVHDQLTP